MAKMKEAGNSQNNSLSNNNNDLKKLMVDRRSMGDAFSEKLHQKSGSTSTPLLASRSKSATSNLTLGDRQDSGFTELLSSTLNNETIITKDVVHDQANTSEELSCISPDKTSEIGELHSQADSLLHCSQDTEPPSQSQPDTQLQSSQDIVPPSQSKRSQILYSSLDSGISTSRTSDLDSDHIRDGLVKMQEYFDKLKKRYHIDCAIGLRMGEEFVDIITEIHNKQIPCLCQILAYLDNQSLRSFEKVCKRWKVICSQDQPARKRLKRLHQQHVSDKENNHKETEGQASTSLVGSMGTPLADIINSPTPSPTLSPEDSQHPLFNSFVEEAKQLKCGETLMKCPRCGGPALMFKEVKRGKCKRKAICGFDFCLICQMDYNECNNVNSCLKNTKKSSKIKVKVNSDKSKRNLRRL